MSEKEAAEAAKPAEPAKSENRLLRDKFEAQKKVLQRMVVRMIDEGAEGGMTAAEVKDLREALVVLGWLPTQLKV